MQTPFAAASHHDVLVLLVQMAVLLLVARLLGELAQRLKLPSVVGEILAGVVLGPSLLSGFFPVLGAWLVPHTPTQGHLLETISLIGAMFLLLLTGLEMDLSLIKRRAKTAIGVSLGGIATTLSTGFLLGWLLPEDMRAEGASHLVFAAFVGIAMSISAIPVIAKVLMDLDMMRRDIGQTIVAAGMSDDTIGWILLSIVAAMATGEGVGIVSIAQTVGMVVGFLIVSLTAGRWLVERLLATVLDRGVSRDRGVTLVVGLAFVWGSITQAMGLEAVLGVFVMGVIFGQMRRLPSDVVHKLEGIGLGVFAPIFFGVAGLKVDLRALLEPRLLLIGFLVIAVASIGKFTGTYLGARLIGRRPHWNALAYGAGLNARGAMEILIATIGLRLGILSTEMFSVIVVMAIATSLMAPPALRYVLSRLEPDEQERERLRREELRQASRLGNLTRALVPVRTRADGAVATQSVESWVLEQVEKSLSITLMSVAPKPDDRAVATEYLATLRKLFPHREVMTRVVVGVEPATAILDEAARDYDLIVVGASEQRAGGEGVFNPVIDTVVRGAPCPTMVIRGHNFEDHFPLKRILVPTSGSAASRTAAELAFMLARGTDAQVMLLNVCERDPSSLRAVGAQDARALRIEAAREGMESLAELAATYEVQVEQLVEFAESVEGEVLRQIEERSVDLLVLGSDVMVGTNRLYLGPRIERMLFDAKCPVLLLNA